MRQARERASAGQISLAAGGRAGLGDADMPTDDTGGAR
jgi:hypothetical protein